MYASLYVDTRMPSLASVGVEWRSWPCWGIRGDESGLRATSRDAFQCIMYLSNTLQYAFLLDDLRLIGWLERVVHREIMIE